jgi:hypothetical protein
MNFPGVGRGSPKGEMGVAHDLGDKDPRSKIQDPEKLQDPNIKLQGARSPRAARALVVWSLRFGVSLELGAWCLVLFPHGGTLCASSKSQSLR